MDIVRSLYAHAKIVKIDSSEALKIPGVLAVITGEDLKKAGNLHWKIFLFGFWWLCRQKPNKKDELEACKIDFA